MTPLQKYLTEVKERSVEADRHVCEIAEHGDKRWRMSIPPQPDDSDMLLVELTRMDVPRLVAMVDKMRAAIDAVTSEQHSHYLRFDRLKQAIAECDELVGDRFGKL